MKDKPERQGAFEVEDIAVKVRRKNSDDGFANFCHALAQLKVGQSIKLANGLPSNYRNAVTIIGHATGFGYVTEKPDDEKETWVRVGRVA